MIDLTNDDLQQPPMASTMPFRPPFGPLRDFMFPPPPPGPPPGLESEEQAETPQWAQPVPGFDDADGVLDGSTPPAAPVSKLGAASPKTPPKLPATRPKADSDAAPGIPGPKTPPRRNPPIRRPTGAYNREGPGFYRLTGLTRVALSTRLL